MVKSEIMRIRLKPDVKYSLIKLKELMGFGDISKTVRHLINCGIGFHGERKDKIRHIKADILKYNISPAELYPDIKIKRSYLGR